MMVLSIGSLLEWAHDRPMLSDRERAFVDRSRVGRLATADRAGAPHVVPVCFVLDRGNLYIAIDEKPKRFDRPLKRVRNILENPAAAFVVDRYDEDWRRLGWVMLRGRAEILECGKEHDRAQALVVARYPQLRTMRLADLPVIALRVERVASWGDLTVG
ncbi:MAG TPA: TIGR03668 family PPOX class F420-dependent oxidoreductase [Stellaceae bacterium]|nr:TIGR03668 family PPOX class F420-dependent oxidoreductase [Stellaceae bacterium]